MEQTEIRRQNANLKELIFTLTDPEEWRRSCALSERSIDAFIGEAAVAGIDKVYLIGHGTSLASAKTAEAWFRRIAGVTACCMPAYHFLREIDACLTDPAHTMVLGYSTGGNTQSVVSGVAGARARGAYGVGMTGEKDSELARVGNWRVISSVDQDCPKPGKEFGGAYSVSHIYAMLASYLLAVRLGLRRGFLTGETARGWIDRLDQTIVLTAASIEPLFAEMLEATANIMRTKAQNAVVIGAGPNTGTVEEAALKIAEFSWDFCAEDDLENLHHGRFRELDEKNIIFLIAPGRRDYDKALDILTGARYSKSVSVLLTGVESEAYRRMADVVIKLPDIEDEYLTPFLYIFPLWFYGYLRAERMGMLVAERRYGLWARDINFRLHYHENGEPKR